MENLLYEEIGNFRDIIVNIVYKLQKYANEFLVFIPNNLAILESCKFDTDVLGFLYCEGEEILKNKILRESIIIDRELRRKYENVCYKIKKLAEDQVICCNMKRIEELEEFKKEFKDSPLTYTSYHYNGSNNQKEDIYDFDKYLNQRMQGYLLTDFTSLCTEMNKDKALKVVCQLHKESDERIKVLRTLVENSTSCYNSANIMNYFIDSMMITLYEISSLKIITKK